MEATRQASTARLDALVAERVAAGHAGGTTSFETKTGYGLDVASDAGLSDALSDRSRSGADKAGLVARLLEGKVAPETALLATRAAGSPRGRRFDRAIEEFLEGVAGRRGQSSAIVTSAVELTPEQNERLRAALTKMYGKPVQTNVVIDPSVVGGIKVAVGDDVIDGTIARRLDEARAHLSG